jgi:hypothetical protein
MKAKHGTLTGSSTVDTITVTGADPGVSVLMVSLPAGTGDAYFTVAANGATAATPTVAGDDTYHLSAAHPALSVNIGQTTSFQVKLISATALGYSIHAE